MTQAEQTNHSQSAGSDAKSTAEDVARKTRDAAYDAVDAAKSQARTHAESAKESVASEVDSLANAMSDASNDLAEGSPQARLTGQAADHLAEVSNAIRDADLQEVVAATTRFARRNPAMFLGGAALLGFAAARFAKSSAPENEGYGRASASYDPAAPQASSRRPMTSTPTTTDVPVGGVGAQGAVR